MITPSSPISNCGLGVLYRPEHGPCSSCNGRKWQGVVARNVGSEWPRIGKVWASSRVEVSRGRRIAQNIAVISAGDFGCSTSEVVGCCWIGRNGEVGLVGGPVTRVQGFRGNVLGRT